MARTCAPVTPMSMPLAFHPMDNQCIAIGHWGVRETWQLLGSPLKSNVPGSRITYLHDPCKGLLHMLFFNQLLLLIQSTQFGQICTLLFTFVLADCTQDHAGNELRVGLSLRNGNGVGYLLSVASRMWKICETQVLSHIFAASAFLAKLL